MRVIHIASGGDLSGASGVGTFVRRIDGELRAQGVESSVATGVTAIGPCRGPLVLHIHGLWLGVQRRAAVWARRRGVPVVWSTHGMTAPWAMHHKWWKKCLPWHLYQRRDLQGAAVIHCTTELEADWNRALGFGKTFIAPLGTALPVADAVRESELAKDGKVLLFVGRIYPVKALDRLLRAFQMTPHEGWRLRIVGPDQSGHLDELKRIAGAEVDFPGPKFGAELAAEYARCDALALVSHTENFGATVVDAMAHGKPVVTSTKTPWKIVAERQCGWWVDNVPEVLCGALREMMALSDAERREMGARGRALVAEKFTWPATAKSLKRVYSELLNP